jgi:hypothetical protein
MTITLKQLLIVSQHMIKNTIARTKKESSFLILEQDTSIREDKLAPHNTVSSKLKEVNYQRMSKYQDLQPNSKIQSPEIDSKLTPTYHDPRVLNS